MAWKTLPPELRELAERVCTPKQLDALKLWDAGLGYRRIGLALHVSPTTARDLVQRALQKMKRAAPDADVPEA